MRIKMSKQPPPAPIASAVGPCPTIIWGWSGGAKVLINLQCRGVLLVWTIVGQGPTALALGAGGGLFGHFFSRLSFLLSFSLSLGDGPI